MISHKYKCVFLHIPKTAGTSIERYLRKLDSNIPEKTPRQRGFTKFLNEFGEKYFVFTFVRNPYERLKSAWRWGEMMYRKYKDQIPYFYKSHSLDFQEYVRMTTDLEYRSKNSTKWSLYDDYHTLPQVAFIPDLNNNIYFGDKITKNFRTDFIGEYENLNDHFDIVLDFIGSSADETKENVFEHVFKSKKDISGDCEYDASLQNMVCDYYIEDFNKFNYDKNSIIL